MNNIHNMSVEYFFNNEYTFAENMSLSKNEIVNEYIFIARRSIELQRIKMKSVKPKSVLGITKHSIT